MLVTACGRAADVADQQPSAAAIDNSPATGKIQVWAFSNEGEALEAIATDFEAENPGTDVVITPVPNEELPRKVDAAVATGNVPDIVQPSTSSATNSAATVPRTPSTDPSGSTTSSTISSTCSTPPG